MAGAEVSILQNDFSRGIRRDRSKDSIGANAAWDLADYVVNRLGAPLRKRGSWEYKGQLSGDTPNRVRSLIFAPFNGGKFILAVDSDGQVFRVAAGSSSWTVDGTTRDVGTLKQNPIFYFDDVFFPSHDGTQTLSRANETTVTEYTFTSGLPAGDQPMYLTQWKNRMVGAVRENIYFGPPGDPNQAWDPASVYQQTQPIKGIAAVRTITLVFYEGHTDRIRGFVPAGYDNIEGDLAFDDLFPDVGLVDAFSLTQYNDLICWADRNGIWMTDGAAPFDLTDACGIKDYWREALRPLEASFNAGDIRVSAGVSGDILHVSVINLTTHAHLYTFVFDIPRRVAWRYTNFPFTCYAKSPYDPKEVFVGVETELDRVGEISHTLEVKSTLVDPQADANGVDVLPVVWFPYHRFAAGILRVVDMYLGYSIDTLPPVGGGDPDVLTFITPEGLTFTGDAADAPLRILLFEVGDTGGLLIVSSVTFVDPGWDVFVAWDAVFGTPTAQEIVDLVNGDIDASAVMAASLGTADASDPIASFADYETLVAGGGGACLLMQFTKQPDPEAPTYSDFNDGQEFLCAADLHGDGDTGYHYRRVPVRLEAAGVAVKVSQVGPSDDTAIYNLSASVIARPGWEQG